MRVGIFDHANDGRRSGVEYYTLGLIGCLARQAEPSELVVYTNDPDAVSEIHTRIIIRRIPGRKHRPLRLWWQHFRLPQKAEADGLDVLHCPAYVMPLRPCRVPCVITVHDIHAISHPEWCSLGNRLHYGMTLPRSLRRAARVIAVSENTREAILRRFGPIRDDIRVIPPGVDDIFTDTVDPAAEPDSRRMHRLPDRYVLHAGNLEPRKNIPAAIEAVRLIRRRGMDHVLVLAGQTIRAPATLIRLVSDARREGVVQTLGYVPRSDLPALYRMAAAVLCVAHHEGFGFPALEAMACGAPVVSSMTGAMRDTLGDAAMAADPDSAQSIADAVGAVVSSAVLRDRLRQEGLRRAADFRWERFAAELRQTYMMACRKPGDRGPVAADR
jgi:glycosyltransferase involved in cell wall biosynthesis